MDGLLDARPGQAEPWRILERLLPPRTFEKGTLLYQQGEPADYFYYLKSGRVIIYLTAENGAEKTLTVLKKGSLFGEAAFFDRLPRVSNARTAEKSQIIAVDRPHLLEYFSEYPSLAVDMLQYVSKTVRMLSNQLDHMAFLRADQRVARLLLDLSRADGSVHCTHEDLGSLAGVTRVTVSKILGRFAERGWLSTGYRDICVQDRQALAEAAYSPKSSN